MTLGLFMLSALVAAQFQVQVQEGTQGNKFVKQQKVEIFAFKGGEEKFTESKLTDSSGKATFTIKPEEPFNLIARTLFHELVYFSDVYSSTAIPKTPVVLRVFQTSKEIGNIHVAELRLSFDVRTDSIFIEEELVVENPSSKTFVGLDGKGDVLRFSIPTGGFDVRFHDGFEQNDTRFEENDLVSTRPLIPGKSRFALSYSVERSARSTSVPFSQSFNIPIHSISLATTPASVSVELKEGELQTSDRSKFFGARTFTLAEARSLKINQLELTLNGLPFRLKRIEVIPWLAILVLMAVAILLTIRKGVKPESGAEAKEGLLNDLAIARKLNRKGLLSDSEYQERRLRLLQRLLPFYQ